MKLAEYQDLYYVKKVDFGVYLAEDMGSETHVLLPSKQVPEDAKPGRKIRVFLYKDSKDRLIATTNTPKLILGEYAPLVVKEVGKIGAFLDWGLEKDLFLPFKQQTHRVHPGEECLVGLYTDICVISNALLAKAALPEVPITVDASCCAGVTPESHENALKAMEMCQIDIVR